MHTPLCRHGYLILLHLWHHSVLNRRAPTLFRRFGAAGEVAVDLLARLLTFDPARRCGCEEALAHEYFEDIRDTLAEEAGGSAAAVAAATVAAAAAAAGRQAASAGGCVVGWVVGWVGLQQGCTFAYTLGIKQVNTGHAAADQQHGHGFGCHFSAPGISTLLVCHNISLCSSTHGVAAAHPDLDMEDAQHTPTLLQQQQPQPQQPQQQQGSGRPPLAPARSNSGEVAAEEAAASVRAVTLNGQKRTRSSSGGGSVDGERRFSKVVSFDLTPDEAAGAFTPDAAAAVAAAAAGAFRGGEGGGDDMELDHHGSPGPQDIFLHHHDHQQQQAGGHPCQGHHSPTRSRPSAAAAAPAGAAVPGTPCKALQRSSSHPELLSTPSGNHYYDIDDPAAALAALEAEMAALISAGEEDAAAGGEGHANGPGSEGLRRLLEKEVQEHSEALHRKQKLVRGL
jgi:hypothetical protein